MIPILGALIGGLMKNGLGLLANVAKKKGKEFIEERTGISLDDTDNLTEEQLLKLKQYEMDHEEELLKIAIEDKKLSIEEQKMFLGDVQDARGMQKQALTGQGDLFSKRFVYYYAAFTTIFTFIYIFWITFGTIPTANIRFADTILGFLIGSIISVIINFFYGSSEGSKEKSEELKDSIASKIKGGN